MRPLIRRSRGTILLFLVVILTTVVAAPINAFPSDSLSHDSSSVAPELLRLLQSDTEGITVQLSTPHYELSTPDPQLALSAGAVASGCRKVRAADMAWTSDPGRPELPVKSVLLGVPPETELQLHVAPAASRAIAAAVSICPALSLPTAGDMATASDEMAVVAQAQEDAATGAPTLDPQVYGKDLLYPAETVRLIDLGFMRGQRIIRLEFYPFQYNPVAGVLQATDQIQATVRFVSGEAVSAKTDSMSAVAEPQDFERAYANALLNYDSARAWRGSAGADAAAAASAWIPPQPGYKVAVKEEGIYHLTWQALSAAGLPVDKLDPRAIRMYGRGAAGAPEEIAILVTGETDGKFDPQDEVIFYGQGVDTRYTDTNIYWLTYGGASGRRMAGRGSIPNGSAVTSYQATVKNEQNTTYDSDLPMLPGYDHWYGQQIQAVGAGKAGSVSIMASTPLPAQGSLTASVSVMLGAVTTGAHRVRLYVNPTSHPVSVFDGTWDGATTHLITAQFPQSHLVQAGNNTIKIEVINDTPGRAADILRLDWVRLDYQRRLVAEKNRLLFGPDGVGWAATGPKRYTLSGFAWADGASAQVDIYDVTDPARVARITGSSSEPAQRALYLPFVLRQIRPQGLAASDLEQQAAWPAPGAATTAPVAATGSDTLTFGDNQASPRRYAAWDSSGELEPLSITLDQPSSLQATLPGADYIVVTHADFYAAIQPLAAYRASQGMRVRVVDVQDVYDEFGGGLMSAEAIRDFVAYAYNNWARPAPAYLLLVGDGTYDFRNYRSNAPNFVPPFLDMVDPEVGETATDNRFVAVTPGDILPDLHVGRLPANTPAEAAAMVNKVLTYEATSTGGANPWTKQVLFVADNLQGGGGNFYAYSDGIADGTTVLNNTEVKILPSEYNANKVYFGKTCDLSEPSVSVECRAQLIDKINGGSLIVSYIGHGVKTYWAAERLYDANSLNSLNNGDRLPVMLPMTCNEGYFVDPTEASLSELGVRAENKGAIASWAPTGLGLAPGHDYLERGFFLAVFHQGDALGSAATSAKLYLTANAPPNTFVDLIDTFLLLGDPALRIR